MVSDSPRTLNDVFFGVAEQRPHDRLLTFRSGAGGDIHYSSAAFVSAVLAFREYLLRLGLAPETRIAIYSENRPEWHIADFGALLAGMVVVPVYPTLSAQQVRYLLTHSEAAVVVVSGLTQQKILESIRSELPNVRTIIRLNGSGSDAPSFERIVSAKSPGIDEAKRSASSIVPGAIASIVYTSGTTGTPKGAVLTHDNFCFDLSQCVDRLGFRSATRALSVLPLAHVFERLLCYGYFRIGIPIAYGDPHDLKQLLELHHPEALGCVPRILEKIRETVEQRLDTLPAWKRNLACTLLNASVGCVLVPGSAGGLGRAVKLTLADLFVHRKVRAQLCGVRYIICGGARLNPEVEAFFRACGFHVLQGYGLTETSPVICLNEFGSGGTGTVGKPLAGVEVRLGPDGEILTRGRHVMKGYYKDADATASAFTGEWFHTGDTGVIDGDGRVRVNGRKSDVIVLSTGKKVSAAAVEAKLESCEFIRNAFVIGTGRKFLSAVIVPDFAKTSALMPGLTNDRDLVRPDVTALYARAIDRCCADLAGFEQVKRFCFLSEHMLAESDLLTPTLKLRKNEFEQRYASYIERLYREDGVFVITAADLRPGKAEAAIS
jgi:long-chain acyl-CoA synthetase